MSTGGGQGEDDYEAQFSDYDDGGNDENLNDFEEDQVPSNEQQQRSNQPYGMSDNNLAESLQDEGAAQNEFDFDDNQNNNEDNEGNNNNYNNEDDAGEFDQPTFYEGVGEVAGENGRQKENKQPSLSQSHFSNTSDEFQKIRSLIMSKQFSRALNEVETYLERSPNHVEAINLKVHCMRQIAGTKDPATNRKCVDLLKKSLQEESGSVLSLFNIASCLYELSDFAQAINYYEQVGNSDARVMFNMAICYERLGDVYHAQVYYDKTLKLNSRLSGAVVNYSNLLMRLGETESSRALLESHLKNAPRDDKALNNLNIALAEKRQDKKADYLFRRVINSTADFAPSLLYNHGVLYFKQNKLIQALEAFQKFTQLSNVEETDPLNLLAYVNQGLIFEKLAQYESALTVYQTILERFGDIVNNNEFEQKIYEMKEKILRRLASKNYNNMNPLLQQQLQQQHSADSNIMPPVNGGNAPVGQMKRLNNNNTNAVINPFMQIKSKYHVSSQQGVFRSSLYSQSVNPSNGLSSQNGVPKELNHSDGVLKNKLTPAQIASQNQQNSENNLVKIDNYFTAGAAPVKQLHRPNAIPAFQRKGSQELSKQKQANHATTSSASAVVNNNNNNLNQNGNQASQPSRNVNFQHLDRLSQPRKQPKDDPNVKPPVENSPKRTGKSTSGSGTATANSAVFDRLARQSKIPDFGSRQSVEHTSKPATNQQNTSQAATGTGSAAPNGIAQSQNKITKPTKLVSLNHHPISRIVISEPIRNNSISQPTVTSKLSPKNVSLQTAAPVNNTQKTGSPNKNKPPSSSSEPNTTNNITQKNTKATPDSPAAVVVAAAPTEIIPEHSQEDNREEQINNPDPESEEQPFVELEQQQGNLVSEQAKHNKQNNNDHQDEQQQNQMPNQQLNESQQKLDSSKQLSPEKPSQQKLPESQGSIPSNEQATSNIPISKQELQIESKTSVEGGQTKQLPVENGSQQILPNEQQKQVPSIVLPDNKTSEKELEKPAEVKTQQQTSGKELQAQQQQIPQPQQQQTISPTGTSENKINPGKSDDSQKPAEVVAALVSNPNPVSPEKQQTKEKDETKVIPAANVVPTVTPVAQSVTPAAPASSGSATKEVSEVAPSKTVQTPNILLNNQPTNTAAPVVVAPTNNTPPAVAVVEQKAPPVVQPKQTSKVEVDQPNKGEEQKSQPQSTATPSSISPPPIQQTQPNNAQNQEQEQKPETQVKVVPQQTQEQTQQQAQINQQSATSIKQQEPATTEGVILQSSKTDSSKAVPTASEKSPEKPKQVVPPISPEQMKQVTNSTSTNEKQESVQPPSTSTEKKIPNSAAAPTEEVDNQRFPQEQKTISPKVGEIAAIAAEAGAQQSALATPLSVQTPRPSEQVLLQKKSSGYQITITQYRSSEKLPDNAIINPVEESQSDRNSIHNTSIDEINKENEQHHQKESESHPSEGTVLQGVNEQTSSNKIESSHQTHHQEENQEQNEQVEQQQEHEVPQHEKKVEAFQQKLGDENMQNQNEQDHEVEQEQHSDHQQKNPGVNGQLVSNEEVVVQPAEANQEEERDNGEEQQQNEEDQEQEEQGTSGQAKIKSEVNQENEENSDDQNNDELKVANQEDNEQGEYADNEASSEDGKVSPSEGEGDTKEQGRETEQEQENVEKEEVSPEDVVKEDDGQAEQTDQQEQNEGQSGDVQAPDQVDEAEQIQGKEKESPEQSAAVDEGAAVDENAEGVKDNNEQVGEQQEQQINEEGKEQENGENVQGEVEQQPAEEVDGKTVEPREDGGQKELLIAQMLSGDVPIPHSESQKSQSQENNMLGSPSNAGASTSNQDQVLMNLNSLEQGSNDFANKDQIQSERARQLLGSESGHSSPQAKSGMMKSSIARSQRSGVAGSSKKGASFPADFEEWTKAKCEQMLSSNDEKSYLAHYKLGVFAIESNDIPVAKKHFMQVAEMQPDFIPERIQFAIAEILVQQKDFEAALVHYKLYYKHAADKFDARMKIGRCFKKLGNFDAAAKSYENAIANNPSKNYLPFYKLGKLKINEEENVKAAIDNFTKALSLSPENIKILLRLGQIYLELDAHKQRQKINGDHEDHEQGDGAHAPKSKQQQENSLEVENHLNEALYYLSQAISIDSNNYEALISLGKLYDKRFELNNAIKFTEIAVAHPDHNTNSVYYLGTLYLKNHDIAQSGNCFKKVLQEDPEHVPSLIEYATILSLKGEFEKSKKYFKIALKKNPNNLICNLRLGKIYQQKLNNMDGAMECYKKIISIEPHYSKAHFQLGLVYANKKDYKHAVESFKQCLTINPKNGAAWREIGIVFQETGNPGKALKYFEKGQQINPEDPRIQSGIANCYYVMEDYDVAIEKFEEIIKKQRVPSASSSSNSSQHISMSSGKRLASANKQKQRKSVTSGAGAEHTHRKENQYEMDEILHNLGDCYFMKDDMDNAIINYEKALKLKSNKPDCLYNLGNAFCMKGRYDEALRTFEKCVELDSMNASAYYNLANVHYILNDQTTAWKYFEKAIENDPENIDWRNYVASTYFDAGNYDNALNHLQASYAVSSKNFDTCYRLTQTFLAVNSQDDAKLYLKMCLDLEPDNEDALRLQEDIMSGRSFSKSRSGSRHSQSMLRDSSHSHIEADSFATGRKNSSSFSMKSNKEQVIAAEPSLLNSIRNKSSRSPISTSVRIPEEKNEGK